MVTMTIAEFLNSTNNDTFQITSDAYTKSFTIEDFLKDANMPGSNQFSTDKVGEFFGRSFQKTLLYLWDGYMHLCKPVCLVLIMAGIIGLVLGWKKGKQLSSGALTIYILSIILNGVFKS